MSRTRKVKKSKGILVLIIALAILALFAYQLLYTGGVVVKRGDSTEVVNKLKFIKLKGGEFQLTQNDMDELSNLYFPKAVNKGAITIQGINMNILNGELLIEAPIKYDNLNLLLTSKGKINFSNGEISYVADNFKIGKLILPKSFIISQISKQNNEIFYVEDNLIKIKESALPFKIEDIKIVDDKIVGTAEKPNIKSLLDDLNNSSAAEIDKQLASLEQKIQGAAKFMNEAQKEKMNQIQSTIDSVKGKSIDEKKKVINDIISKINKAESEAKGQ